MDWIRQYWLQALFGLIVAGLTWAVKTLYSRLTKKIAELDATKDGTRAILHDRLYQACQHHIGKQYIDAGELKNLTYLYDAYASLGGNGTCKTLYIQCTNLRLVTEQQIRELMAEKMKGEAKE